MRTLGALLHFDPVMTSFRTLAPAACFALILPLQAQATLGLFGHGNGVKSIGIGGVGCSFAEEPTVLAANPAHALALGNRFDIGVDVFRAEAEAIYENNNVDPDQFDPNQTRLSDGRRYFAIPQGGVSVALSERWALGVAVLSPVWARITAAVPMCASAAGRARACNWPRPAW